MWAKRTTRVLLTGGRKGEGRGGDNELVFPAASNPTSKTRLSFRDCHLAKNLEKGWPILGALLSKQSTLVQEKEEAKIRYSSGRQNKSKRDRQQSKHNIDVPINILSIDSVCRGFKSRQNKTRQNKQGTTR
jgi:hypothetical protein